MKLTDSEYEELRFLFDELVDLPANDRSEILERTALRSPRVFDELKTLLKNADSPMRILPVDSVAALPQAGNQLGDYRLLRLLGTGGMGEVWLAQQSAPVSRVVAVKMIKPGMDTRTVIERFRSERQTLARLSHPCVAQVLDANVTDQGRPYFVMEYIDGMPIDRFAESRNLSLNQRLRLIQRVCDGVQHAHDRGILHRDLKPTNILVECKGAEWLPKIIDFGVAKALLEDADSDTRLTQVGQAVGTPEFMSPEQQSSPHGDVDTRSDVFSLGVILKLLTQESQAVTRGTDLETVLTKATAVEAKQRYDAPRELAADIERYLSGHPVIARAATPTYLIWKFALRHRLAMSLSALILLSVIIGVIATTFSWQRAIKAEAVANREAQTAEQTLNFIVGMFQAADPINGLGVSATPLELVTRGASQLKGSEFSDPAVNIRLGQAIGEVYTYLGEHDSARKILLSTFQEQRALPDLDVETKLRTRELLAFNFWAHGPVQEAEPHQSAVYEGLVGLLGAKNATSLEAGRFLAEILERNGRLVSAEGLAQSVVGQFQGVHGHDDLKLKAEATLAEIHHRLGRWENAEKRIRRVIAAQQRLYGNDHLATAESELILAEILISQKDYADAETRLIRLHQLVRNAFGPDHKANFRLHQVLGDLRHQEGRFQEAFSHYQLAFDGYQSLLSSDHPDLIRVEQQLVQSKKQLIGD